ncbi:hypothetical protein [Microbacterium sp. 1P10AE]|jgi:hypothetical protein|uniref:hypothetical protein n=1 Tax=Microbacterium sp. 1P10AE TaxID=3132286 RepID=UPI0039A3C7D7
MSETNQPVPADLSGTVDERIAQLASLEAGSEQLPPEWVLRQLRSTLASWATDATEVDIEVEKRTDY